MPTSSFLKAVAAGAMLMAPLALASGQLQTILADQLRDNARCSCASAADCTCKKGTCKCPKCGNGKKAIRMFESLKPMDGKLPDTARRDASAGVLI